MNDGHTSAGSTGSFVIHLNVARFRIHRAPQGGIIYRSAGIDPDAIISANLQKNPCPLALFLMLPGGTRLWHGLTVVWLCLGLVGCRDTRPEDDEMRDESSGFENIRADYVGDAACFDCHEEQYRGYEQHGMARSVYPLTPENVVENFGDVLVSDDRSGYQYSVFERNGRFYQEEFRRDPGGERSHSLVREMEYVVGSGSAARTYMTEINGRYYQLPLTWYTQEKRWYFSPGYDVANARFDRLIPDRCIACHNSYPESVPHVEGKYADMPHGIGCERCHGPGSLHLDARLESPQPAEDVDATIVNPAHLSLERRLDVCQQCHLHTTVSVLRKGRTAYDYRPSQPLAAYVGMFTVASGRSEDEIDVISHADRMKQSACFIETQAGERPMDCLTCHNPHEGFREAGPEYFNATCLSCHNLALLEEELSTDEVKAIHSHDSNCFGCHMPKVRAEGTPHASFTDHRIRVVEERLVDVSGAVPLAAEPTPIRRAALEPYFTHDRDGREGEIYKGMAYIVYGRQNVDSAALEEGITLLKTNLNSDDDFGEAHFLLGFAHLHLLQVEEAIPALEKAIAADPDVPERLNALAQAYEAFGRSAPEIERLYTRALSLQPAQAEIRVNYGRFLENQNRLADAIRHYQTAVEEQPWLATAHYNLGTAYLRAGEYDEAESALREAIHLEPDYVDALGNLGLLLAATGHERDARPFFERAAAAAPNNAVALGNLGAYHLNAGSPEAAITLLRRSVVADPNYVDGWVNLALAHLRTGDTESARQYADNALRLDPNNQRAREVLEAL